MKIILIICVVVGHGTFYSIITPYGQIDYSGLMAESGIEDAVFHTIAKEITGFVYSFHMPAYVFVSGILFGKQLLNDKFHSFTDLLKNKAKRLLIPLMIVYLAWNVPIKVITGYYLGHSWYSIFLQMVFINSVYLWYLEALFFIFLLVYLLEKRLTSNFGKLAIFFVFYVIGIIVELKLKAYVPFGNPLKYMLWFGIGVHIEKIVGLVKKFHLWNNFIFIFAIMTQVILYTVGRICNRGVLLLNSFILPGIGIFILYYYVANLSNGYYEKKAQYICNISRYTFGIYLYAEPLNYLVLFVFWKLFGIEAFGRESVAVGIYFTRLVGTTMVAILITKVLNRLKWEYLF